ncbi:MAG: exodeoxyribonuclease VII large subunit [Candidatus Pacebacteria bacterium]|nr:exodeoxyribonuclease VII large subunit [Candidatus Paceibacterota bacterium]
MEIPEKKIFSVSEFIELLNIGLKRSKAKITGEVTQMQVASSGHVYFTLKDESNGAVLDCIIWRSKYNLFGIRMETGMKIIAQGYPEVYAPRGKLSFIAETIELSGEGELKKQYEELKKKLAAEGLFAEERKKPIPRYCRKIGVITSKHGAVLADFLNNLGKFGFQIQMIDSRVEGQEAVEDLLGALRTFKKKDIDVLVIIRGGGSLESLMAFNNETLVREAATFKVPLITGVGHHQDEPLITFVADASVSTPTAAANILNRPWEEALLFLERQERAILGFYQEIFDGYKEMENRLMVSLQNFKNALRGIDLKLKDSLGRIVSGMKLMLSSLSQKISYAEKSVDLNNPERQLSLGYAIASVRGKVIRRTKDVSVGDDFELRVSDGKINSEVKKINPDK